ncbi:MAG: flavodoxin domain-containing protein [Lactobacillaceae bacterium]|jgi:flavodoxin short chain|nr:flavodoxin domain-containing protein [Lactobacillaceae bacterium]
MKAIVMYASITGNNEEIAEFVQEELNNRGVETEIEDLFDGDEDAADDKDLIIVSPYTYDKGSIPSEMIDFFESLNDKDWTGKQYVVIGSGDRFYGKDFGAATDRFDEQMKKTGATELSGPFKIHTRIDDNDKAALRTLFDARLPKG